MPILVRPVREQLEHDRVIRHLQVKLKRKYDVAVNIGDEKNAPVKAGPLTVYPDLVLTSSERGRRLAGVIEVETGESVNHLEAMAQWVHLGRVRVPFHLYVPAGAVDIAKRLAADNAVNLSEIWTYHAIGDQMRFTMIHRAPAPAPRKREPAEPAARHASGRPEPARSARRKPARTVSSKAGAARDARRAPTPKKPKRKK